MAEGRDKVEIFYSDIVDDEGNVAPVSMKLTGVSGLDVSLTKIPPEELAMPENVIRVQVPDRVAYWRVGPYRRRFDTYEAADGFRDRPGFRRLRVRAFNAAGKIVSKAKVEDRSPSLGESA